MQGNVGVYAVKRRKKPIQKKYVLKSALFTLA